MSPTDIAQALEAYGAWALLTFVSIAYWRKDAQLNDERKDRDIQTKEFHNHLLAVIESNTEANIKLESAIDSLSRGLDGLHNIIMKALKLV
jgi:hypothetical protein